MTDFVAEMSRTLAEAEPAERRAILRALMPTVVRWFKQSLEAEDPEAGPDVALQLWADEMSAGLIGPLCTATQEARATTGSGRTRRRVQGHHHPRAGG